MLFADIADSTGLAERLGPRRFGEILSRYYADMTEIVFDHGGLLDKYLGDGVMAIFGMTESQADPEGRAVRAGLSMLDRVETMNREHGKGERIAIGVGINTGPVMVGYVGTDERVELTAIGDTVNVASHLQIHARPNRVLVAPATCAAIAGRFSFQRIGQVEIKGRKEQIQVYEILQ
jgi:adenylate cyclase